MKKDLLFLLLLNFTLFAQEDAWVYFKDKPHEKAFFDNPLIALSQRSIDRRVTQGIVLDSKDAPIEEDYVNKVSNTTGITVLSKSKWLNYVHVRGSQSAISSLKANDFVSQIVFANHNLNTSLRTISSKKTVQKLKTVDKTQQIAVNFDYGTSATQVQMLKAHTLHERNYTGKGKIIAILDGGFPGVDTALPFKRLRDNNLLLGGYDFVKKSPSFYTGNSHGTMVLSTMGGYTDNLVGTAPDAAYYLFITEDGAREEPLELSYWVAAAEEADRLGVDVINSSLGYFEFDNPAYSYSYSMMNGQTSVASKAVDIAFEKGMLCVISAGNEGNAIEPHVGSPADAAFGITVGSVTESLAKSSFSSIGPTSDGRIKPDVMAMGTLSTVAKPDGSIGMANGTSFSSPILAGALTSLWSAYPEKKNVEIVRAMRASSDRFLTPDNNYGYGVPDFSKALITALSHSISDKNMASIYPNPAQNQLFVQLDTNQFEAGYLLVYNVLGQVQCKKEIQQTSNVLDIESWQNGIYLYTLYYGKQQLQGKFLKN